MTLIAYVCPPSDLAKIHRLVEPVVSLTSADGRKLVCGRTFRGGAGSAGWYEYDHDRASYCSQCKRVDE